MIKETGGPAFPTEHTDTSGQFDGMTLRDFFAAQALIGWRDSTRSAQEDAEDAYIMADAMLKAREAA